ncbi:MAG: hypothetical protein AAB947_01875 [Patescibacteria group bacterium]
MSDLERTGANNTPKEAFGGETDTALAELEGEVDDVREQIRIKLGQILSEHGLIEGKRIADLVAARLEGVGNKHVVIESSLRGDGGTDIEILDDADKRMRRRLARFALNRGEGKRHLMYSLKEGETEVQ